MHYLNVYLPTHLGVLFYLFVNNINYYKRRLLRYVKIEAFFLSFFLWRSAVDAYPAKGYGVMCMYVCIVPIITYNLFVSSRSHRLIALVLD